MTFDGLIAMFDSKREKDETEIFTLLYWFFFDFVFFDCSETTQNVSCIVNNIYVIQPTLQPNM